MDKIKGQKVLKFMMEEGPRVPELARERELEQVSRRLENRVAELEAKLDQVNAQLEDQNLIVRSSAQKKEVDRIADLFESRVQRFAEEFSPEKKGIDNPVAHYIYQQVVRLSEAVSLDGFKHLLASLWYGGLPQDIDVDEFGMDAHFARRVKPFFDFLYYTYWRISVSGVENLPEKGRGLVVSNHSGTLPYDGCMIRLASENEHPQHRDIRFLVEDFVYHFPFLGNFMYRTGGVRACPENATRLLEADHLVAVFPEGVKGIGKLYKNRYNLQRFGRGGFIRLALRTGSPIIPTAVIGAEEIHPMLYKSTLMAKPLGVPYFPVTPTFPLLGLAGLIPLPSKWKIIFGEPISLKKYGPKHADDPLLVNQLSEQVRVKIQEMVFEGLAKRRSIWFG